MVSALLIRVFLLFSFTLGGEAVVGFTLGGESVGLFTLGGESVFSLCVGCLVTGLRGITLEPILG